MLAEMQAIYFMGYNMPVVRFKEGGQIYLCIRGSAHTTRPLIAYLH